MQVRFKIKFRDLLAFCTYHCPRSVFVIGVYGIIFLLLSFTIVQALPAEVNHVSKIIIFLITEMLALVLIAIIFALLMVVGMVSGRNKTLLTDHALTFEDDTFIVETKYKRTEHRWFGVQKLARTRRHLFIYVSQHSAHVIPRRAFKDRSEWDSFCEYCRSKKQAV